MPRDDDADLQEDSEDFASMLEDSLEPRSFKEGETVEGPIVAFGESVAFVDIGGKGEATAEKGGALARPPPSSPGRPLTGPFTARSSRICWFGQSAGRTSGNRTRRCLRRRSR